MRWRRSSRCACLRRPVPLCCHLPSTPAAASALGSPSHARQCCCHKTLHRAHHPTTLHRRRAMNRTMTTPSASARAWPPRRRRSASTASPCCSGGSCRRQRRRVSTAGRPVAGDSGLAGLQQLSAQIMAQPGVECTAPRSITSTRILPAPLHRCRPHIPSCSLHRGPAQRAAATCPQARQAQHPAASGRRRRGGWRREAGRRAQAAGLAAAQAARRKVCGSQLGARLHAFGTSAARYASAAPHGASCCQLCEVQLSWRACRPAKGAKGKSRKPTPPPDDESAPPAAKRAKAVPQKKAAAAAAASSKQAAAAEPER